MPRRILPKTREPLYLAATIALMAGALGAQQRPVHEPFGFHRGMTRAEVIKAVGAASIDTKHSQGDFLSVSTAPKPYSAFEAYNLWFSPSQGLLKISAIGKTIQTNRFGEQIRVAYGEISKALRATYGEPEVLDFLKTGSIWKEPEDWTMGLLKEEREYSEYWSKYSLKLADMSGIVLEALALSDERGYLIVSYEFEGWEEYVEAKKADAGKVF